MPFTSPVDLGTKPVFKVSLQRRAWCRLWALAKQKENHECSPKSKAETQPSLHLPTLALYAAEVAGGSLILVSLWLLASLLGALQSQRSKSRWPEWIPPPQSDSGLGATTVNLGGNQGRFQGRVGCNSGLSLLRVELLSALISYVKVLTPNGPECDLIWK